MYVTRVHEYKLEAVCSCRCLTKLRSYEIMNTPGSCNLFPLEKDGKAEVEEEGKGWVSGYDLEKGSVPTPSKMPGASKTCSISYAAGSVFLLDCDRLGPSPILT